MPQVNNLAILPKQNFKELTQVLWSYSAQQDMVYLSNNLARFEGPPGLEEFHFGGTIPSKQG